MEITWHGHSCFRLSERGMASVVCDPYDHRVVGFEPLKLKADIVTISSDTPEHGHLGAVKGDYYEIKGAGEYEVGGVFITGVQTGGIGKRAGSEPRNTVYVIDYGGLAIAHLGTLNRVPNQTEVEAFGPVNIMLVPVGDGDSLNAAKAAEMISLLEPNIVIPMHYADPAEKVKLEPLGKFLKEMGLGETEKLPSLKVTSVNALPVETRVVVLDHAFSG
ncbi:MAG: MBL fold metallo-hydrolase [Anaerolineae bacterium]|jgi:L-ascorbate metabolism protein UlaG (beta-lactamase superfamily)|nr:MBL fold metallo-hydrolase [Anaerolineae bacterium]